MFENPRTGRQARNFTKNVPNILDLKSSSEQIFSENWRCVSLQEPIGSWSLSIVSLYCRRLKTSRAEVELQSSQLYSSAVAQGGVERGLYFLSLLNKALLIDPNNFVRAYQHAYKELCKCDYQNYSRLSLNGHLYKTDTSLKRTPGVGPCLSLLPLFDSL